MDALRGTPIPHAPCRIPHYEKRERNTRWRRVPPASARNRSPRKTISANKIKALTASHSKLAGEPRNNPPPPSVGKTRRPICSGLIRIGSGEKKIEKNARATKGGKHSTPP